MALEKLQKTDGAAPFKFNEKGDKLAGFYIKTDEISINGSPAKRSTFRTREGLVSVLGQFDMVKQLQENGCQGNYVEITFSGNIQRLKGGRTMKLYDVDVDRDQKLDASATGGDLEEGSDSIDEEEEEVLDEVAPIRASKTAPRASTPSAANQAKVQNLFNRSK